MPEDLVFHCHRGFVALGLLPQRFHLVARDVGESGALLAGNPLHFAEAARELGRGFFGGNFGVDVQETGEIDDHEEDIAELGFDPARVFLRGREHGAELAGFLGEFVEDSVDVIPVEADACGPAGKLVAFE